MTNKSATNLRDVGIIATIVLVSVILLKFSSKDDSIKVASAGASAAVVAANQSVVNPSSQIAGDFKEESANLTDTFQALPESSSESIANVLEPSWIVSRAIDDTVVMDVPPEIEATSGTVNSGTSRGGSSSGGGAGGSSSGDSSDGGATGERLTGGAGTSGDSTSSGSGSTDAVSSGQDSTGVTTTTGGGGSGSRGDVSVTSGDSTLMGMKIESSYFADGAFLVETTGARFEYDLNNLIISYGKEFQKDVLFTIKFINKPSFQKTSESFSEIHLDSPETEIQITGDGKCLINFKEALSIEINSNNELLKQNETLVFKNTRFIKKYPNKDVAVETTPFFEIWWHNIATQTTTLESLETILDNHIADTIIFWYYNPKDFAITDSKVISALSMAKKYNVKIIWCRDLWPLYAVEDFEETDFYDPNYYSDIIREIRKEATQLGADYTAIDLEPYANFPFKNIKQSPLDDIKYNKIKTAVDIAVKETGQTDFVLPASGWAAYYIYNTLKDLGKLKIAEHTYYNIPAKISDKNRPYDIIGLYINTTPENHSVPTAPYFTADNILEHQNLWKNKNGLMLYPLENNIDKTAKELAKYRYWIIDYN